jgi:hypothetical protein
MTCGWLLCLSLSMTLFFTHNTLSLSLSVFLSLSITHTCAHTHTHTHTRHCHLHTMTAHCLHLLLPDPQHCPRFIGWAPSASWDGSCWGHCSSYPGQCLPWGSISLLPTWWTRIHCSNRGAIIHLTHQTESSFLLIVHHTIPAPCYCPNWCIWWLKWHPCHWPLLSNASTPNK